MTKIEIDISILVINYNSDKYIHQCLKSVNQQITDANIQLVIMDDFSTDDSAKVIEQLLIDSKNSFSSVVVHIQPENKGCYINMVDGIKLCEGKYIAYLEGDDYWSSKTKIQDQWEFLNDNLQYNGIGTGCSFINESDQKIEQKWYDTSEEKAFDNKDLWGYPPFQTSTLMFRRGALPTLPGYFKKTTTNDKILFVLLSITAPLYYNPIVTTKYRYHSGNLTSNYSTLSNTLIRPLDTNILLLRFVGFKYTGVFIKSLGELLVNSLRHSYYSLKPKH